MTARIHHYVSQCYLKGFTFDGRKDSKLFVVDLKRNRSFETIPKNVAAERDFNRIDADGLRPDALEAGLAEFEDKLAPALTRIIEARSISDEEDRAQLLNLIGLLHMRNPRNREVIQDIEERLMKGLMQHTVSSPERWESTVRGAAAAGYFIGDPPLNYEVMKEFVRPRRVFSRIRARGSYRAGTGHLRKDTSSLI